MPRLYTAQASSNLSTRPDTYIFQLVRASPTGICAISSDDTLRFFDPSTLQLNVVRKTSHSGPTALCLVSPRVLATSGTDGNVRIWDSRQLGTVAEFRGNGAELLSLAVDTGTNTIAAGTELHNHSASVLLWDLRSSAEKAALCESHNDDVTALQFHPGISGMLVSGGTDALVNVFNVNLLGGEGAEGETPDDRALVQTVNHGSSVHKAVFFAQEKNVVAVSHDERLAVHWLNETGGEVELPEGEECREFGDVRKKLGCEYVVDVIPQSEGGGFVVAGNTAEQWVDVVPLKKRGGSMWSWEFSGENGVRLVGGHGEDVVRDVVLEDGVVYSCGEDGRVNIWKEATEAEEELESGGRRHSKTDGKNRFRPY